MSLAARLQDAIAAAIGQPAEPVSITIDFGVQGPGEPAITARVDRATRSLVFASGEARWPDGRAAAAASGVWRITGG